MKNAYELWPGQYFLERRTGAGSWTALSRDNDYEVMEIRYAFQIEMLTPGYSVRLVDWKGKVLKENTL